MSQYTVRIVRGSETGRLSFNHAGLQIHTTAYWDEKVRIPAGVYTGCSATRMTNKTVPGTNEKRPGIFIPNVKGHSGIFIHMGRRPFSNWSDGCIVIEEGKMDTLWNAIEPKDGRNVTVVVSELS